MSGNTPTFVDVHDVAEILGVCERQVRNLVKDYELPHIRVGKRRLAFNRDSIYAWAMSRERVLKSDSAPVEKGSPR